MKPSNASVLRLLRIRGADGLTEAESTATIACRRLAARVWELRQAGYEIDSAPERAPNGAVYSRYFLVEDEPEEEFLREGLPEFSGAFR